MPKKEKLIKMQGKYYTPTAYQNQFPQYTDVDPYDAPEPRKVKKINSNPVPGKTRIGKLAGGLRGGFGGGGMNWQTK